MIGWEGGRKWVSVVSLLEERVTKLQGGRRIPVRLSGVRDVIWVHALFNVGTDGCIAKYLLIRVYTHNFIHFLTESDGDKTIPQQQHTYHPDFVCKVQGNEPELPGEMAFSRVERKSLTL